ncbi:Tab2/Atab2 family RNA-binding protein [Geitlerinema calcuttense]|uniref:Tab2/Atab2 family RNA-binding protein n=1 Tax=Geitlerinema calcuttense NRMC-F 0142 TaxID=2922238 RepID=A0ABT7LZ80_9CYAN|nr:Tab2/Atab2 family RNA-binding protein [Geitlerinema calcuttense]MDL5057324.1 Tab2/Atab2 family RNA-binding protein [Geitlerinema calcuttense NRMC-F 0142]
MSRIWQVDIYRSPQKNGQPFWELLICDATRQLTYEARCLQSEVNQAWLISQLQQAAATLPEVIQVFRPVAYNLLEGVGKHLGIEIEPTRRTLALKQWLTERSVPGSSPLALDKPPPLPLPENLWGDRWRFASLAAGNLVEAFSARPIPIRHLPEALFPLNLGLASTVPIPGAVIDGGRQSMRLARWLQEVRPAALNYIPGEPDGLILEAGLVDRWVLETFSDRQVAAAGQTFLQRQKASLGLHFLLVQPDDSGMTYTGFWLLQREF